MKFKYIFLAIIFLIIGKIAVTEVFDNRPFKFEKYKSTEELEEAVKTQCPIGMDINQSIKMLEQSGAECYKYEDDDKHENYIYTIKCEYNTSYISLHPLENYRIWLYGNKEQKIVRIGTHRVAGLMLITW